LAQLRRVKHHVGVRGEGLVAGEAAFRTEVDRLCPDEHNSIEMFAQSIEGVE
jgi:hypothetical protein